MFIACLVIANVTASKIVNVFGLEFPAGFLAYAITFLVTDIVSEVYGREVAKKIVIAGLLANILLILYIYFTISLPITSWQIDYQEIYTKVLGASPCIVVASIIAYLVSQFHDVYTFHKIKELTRSRYLWLRNNVSTIISQFIDTCIFITLAFHVLPLILYGYFIIPGHALLKVILSQYIMKVIVALCDTPFCYLLVNTLQKIKAINMKN